MTPPFGEVKAAAALRRPRRAGRVGRRRRTPAARPRRDPRPRRSEAFGARGSGCTAAAGRVRRAWPGPYICVMTAPEAPVGRLLVCPTPIGNLEDVTLRVLSVLARRGRDRMRGHPPHQAPAGAPRHQRAPARPARAQRTRAGTPRSPTASARGTASPWSPTPARRSCRDPGFALVRECIARRPAGRGAAGAIRADHRADRLGPAGRQLALRRASCRGRAPSWRRCWRARRRPSSHSSRPGGCPPRSS